MPSTRCLKPLHLHVSLDFSSLGQPPGWSLFHSNPCLDVSETPPPPKPTPELPIPPLCFIFLQSSSHPLLYKVLWGGSLPISVGFSTSAAPGTIQTGGGSVGGASSLVTGFGSVCSFSGPQNPSALWVPQGLSACGHQSFTLVSACGLQVAAPATRLSRAGPSWLLVQTGVGALCLLGRWLLSETGPEAGLCPGRSVGRQGDRS